MKAIGIIAMIFAVISIFIPVIGPYLTIVCAILAAFAAGPGITFGAVAIGVNILNVAFLSPSLWITAGASEVEHAGSGSDVLLGMGIVFIGAQVVSAIILIMFHKRWKRKKITV